MHHCVLLCASLCIAVCVTVYYCVHHCVILCVPQDDALATVRSVTSQMKDLDEERERTENRLRVLQKSLGEVEEGKGMCAAVYSQSAAVCSQCVAVCSQCAAVCSQCAAVCSQCAAVCLFP